MIFGNPTREETYGLLFVRGFKEEYNLGRVIASIQHGKEDIVS